jgi:hypothetical protein
MGGAGQESKCAAGAIETADFGAWTSKLRKQLILVHEQ